MSYAELIFNELAEEKLGRRGITRAEILQVRDNDPVLTVNPRPRREGSRLMIGPTDGGRMLTVVIDPHAYADSTWHVASAWNASPDQISTYRQSR